MTLTKEDLEAIRKLTHEETAPMREAIRQLLHAQVEIVEKISNLEKTMHLVMHHFNLTPTSRELKKSLQTLD